jgi:hypothetical protein
MIDKQLTEKLKDQLMDLNKKERQKFEDIINKYNGKILDNKSCDKILKLFEKSCNKLASTTVMLISLLRNRKLMAKVLKK